MKMVFINFKSFTRASVPLALQQDPHLHSSGGPAALFSTISTLGG